MSALAADPLKDAVLAAVQFAAEGTPAGNVTTGRGTLDGQALCVILVENRSASGSLGTVEAERLVAALTIARHERRPVLLLLDSAGAKVSEALRALGAFRRLYRAALDARLAGLPMAAVLGRNVFGGASMLAHVAPQRLFDPRGRLAMSGPSILAAAAGMDPLDDMFKAMADATLSPAARAQASPGNQVWTDVLDLAGWLRAALVPMPDAILALRALHETLGRRLPQRPAAPAQEIHRREFPKLYPDGAAITESDGLVTGTGQRGGEAIAVLGILSRSPVGADRAWRFADAAWKLAEAKASRVEVLLDCESHAARLDDEKVVLSEYIAAMSFALAALAASGAQVELVILGKAGGGVYVALAAPVHRVVVEHGAQVQVLPGAAVAAILGEGADSAPPAAESVAAGVADAELRLGFVDIL